jgi:nucleotide-binding universal stress UspA family protein
VTDVLLAAASVHTTAAACDYLAGRLGGADRVTVLTVETEAVAGRDAGDAANVARTRLVEPAVDSTTRTGDPATVIRETATERDAEEIVLGSQRGDPAEAGQPPGSTVRALLADPPVPTVVVSV